VWALVAAALMWLLLQLVGRIGGPDPSSVVGGLVALNGIVTTGAVIVLGALAVALGAGVLRRAT
jgi:hypothetical protein